MAPLAFVRAYMQQTPLSESLTVGAGAIFFNYHFMVCEALSILIGILPSLESWVHSQDLVGAFSGCSLLVGPGFGFRDIRTRPLEVSEVAWAPRLWPAPRAFRF